jgi:chemotaxis protein MotA
MTWKPQANRRFFKKYPDFLKDHLVTDFVCDTLRMTITGGVEPL